MQTDTLLLSAANIEIFIFVAACAVLIADLFVPAHYRAQLHWCVIAALLVAAHAAFGGVDEEAVVALGGFFVASPMTAALKGVALLAVAGCLGFSRHALRAVGMLNGDFWGLALLATLGMLVMISAAHLLSLYLGLELMSLCLYALIGMRRNSVLASEAAIKYFVLGALASGLFLYGVSMIYGATGELGIAEIAAAIASEQDTGINIVLIFGLVFMLAGMAFKLGAAPFHMWLPDVYQGAYAPITLFVAAAPKVAALAMLLRVLTEALPALLFDWRQMLMFLAVASLAVGNITAIAQTNLKRMLAYSAIAHSGFVLFGVLAGDEGGVAAAMFYISAYALMTVGGFGVIVLLTIGGRERAELADMRGLAARNMPMALIIAALMLSMAGIPPFVGFIAKLTVLEAVVNTGFVWLAVVAVLLSLVGAFYYLRVVRLMFFEKPVDGMGALRLRPTAQALLVLIGVGVLWYGVFPGDLLGLFEQTVNVSR